MTDQQPPPPKKSLRSPLYNFKASPALHEAAEKAARRAGMSKSEWTRRQLEDATGLSGHLVIRVVVSDPNLARMIDAAVKAQQTTLRAFVLESVEAEARRQLERVVREPVTPADPDPDPKCKHPAPAQHQIVNRVVCRACGKIIRWL